MHKYYLISNATHLNKELIDELNIHHQDSTIILFNHSNPLKFVENKKNRKILFIRETEKKLTGIDTDMKHYTKVYFFITSEKEVFEHQFKKLDEIGVNYEIFNINEFIQEHHSEYPENNLPTCGFLGYLYTLKNNHKDDIALVGFTGHHSNGHNYTGIEHNYEYEQIYYKKNDITIYHKSK